MRRTDFDSYGWIEYFTEGPLAGKYARYIEEVSEEMADAIIYATAKREGAKLVTSDEHFKGFELRTLNL